MEIGHNCIQIITSEWIVEALILIMIDYNYACMHTQLKKQTSG